MSVTTLEKLVVIMHRFGIDFNEFNIKFENVEQQEASAIFSDNIPLPQAPTLWSPYNLIFDSFVFVSSSHLGNGVYNYFNPPGSYPILTASNPINSVNGSFIFWISSSVDNGTFTLLQPSPALPTYPQISVSPNVLGFEVTLPTSRNIYTPSTVGQILYEQWGLVVFTQNNNSHKIYHNNLLTYTGTINNITGTLGFYLYDHTIANIAFTNREITPAQIIDLYNAGVTSDYTKILGFTPEAYWRGVPISGTSYYVPNEVF